VTPRLGVFTFSRFRNWPVQLGILLAALPVVGQPGNQSGQIAGTARSVSGQALSGASIVIAPPESDARPASVSTDASGKYAFVNVRYGSYTLVASAAGFRQSEPRRLTLASAAETVDFSLAPLSATDATDVSTSGSKAGSDRRPPAFTAAGVQGTIAPSGYSTGLSGEETSQVMDRVGGLDHEVLSALAPGGGVPDCKKEADLLKAVQANPSSFASNHALGIFYFGHGDFTQSISYLQKASQLRPADSSNSRALALAFMGAGQFPDTIKFLEPIADSGARDSGLVTILAMAYGASGNPQKSIAEYQRAASMDSGEGNLFACGIGLIGLGAADEAGRLFTAATIAHPGTARLWMGLGIAQDLQKQTADAAQSLLRAVDVDPEYLPSYSFLAAVAPSTELGAEVRAKAKERLAVLVVAHPESAVAHYNYALALWSQRALTPAAASAAEIESQLKLAIEKDPSMAWAHFQLGVVYADSGDYANAAAELQQTVRLEPGNAEAHYRLAQAYRRNQQAELASQEMRRFLALHGDAANGKEGSDADVGKLVSELSLQVTKSAPCPARNP
jgi:tetratricopeptide (TPR) repeat protein